MKMLITSGGTKVPIDSVRDITNMSQGTFGSKIAKEALLHGWEVDFLCAKNSKTPFAFRYDLHTQQNHADGFLQFSEMVHFYNNYHDKYREFSFRNFSDYEDSLWSLLDEEVEGGGNNPDVVVLAAAVSDYGVSPISGKIRSGSDLTLNFYPYPKLISEVKKRHPNVFLVGFKLLVGSTIEQLTEEVEKSLHYNDCDLVVGNDLSDIKDSRHRLLIGIKGENPFLLESNDLAKNLILQINHCWTFR